MISQLSDSARKLFLLGVGAVATSAEKGQEVVDELVEKGELTVKQGKALNEELTRKAKDCVSGSSDAILRARLESMTAVERAEYAAKVSKIAKEVEESVKHVTVPVEEVNDKPVEEIIEAAAEEE